MIISMLLNNIILIIESSKTYIINKPIPYDFNLLAFLQVSTAILFEIIKFAATVATPIILYKIYKKMK